MSDRSNSKDSDLSEREFDSTLATQRWILSFLAIGMILVSVQGAYLYEEYLSLASARANLNRKTQELFEISKALAAVQEAETGQRGYILTGKSSYLVPYSHALEEIPKRMQVLRALTALEPEQSRQLAAISNLVDKKLQEMAIPIGIYRASGQPAAINYINTDRGYAVMKNIKEQFDALDTIEREQLRDETRQLTARRQIFSNTFITLGVSSLLLFVGVGCFMRLFVALTAKSRRAERLLRQSVLERSKELEAQAQLLDLTHDTIIVRDLEGSIRFWNRGGELAYGYTSEEAIGRISHDLLKTEFPKPLSDINRELLANSRWEGELVHYASDGRKIIVSSRWALKVNDEGQATAVMEINNDVTAEKEAKRVLLETLHNRAEERLRRVVEAAPDGIMVMDAQGKIIIANSQIELFTGVDKSQLLEHSIESYVPELFEAIQNWDPREMGSPQSKMIGVENELVVHGKNGKNWLVEIGISPLLEDEKLYFIASIVDVRIRKHAEANKANMAAIVESSEAAIISMGLDGIVRSWNRAAEKVFGYSSSEMINESISRIIPDDKRDEELDLINSTKRTLEPQQLETIRVKKDGTKIFVAVTISPLRSASGKLIGVSKIARDITERIRAEENLRRKVLELERSNDELNQFAYVCSHDLQEPLRVIANFNQLLAKRYRGKLDDKADEFIGFTVDASKRMQSLINDLLMYSRVQTKEKTLRPVECTNSVRTAQANLKLAIEESGATFHISELPCVLGDSSQLVQLFQNLIGNAIKFRTEKSPVINISAEKKGDDWIFCVADNGLGLDMQFADKVFVIFQRLHDREAFSGSGIGLAICKKIVQQHGGKIWVESRLGHGASFFFSIPAAFVDVASGVSHNC
jgi:PAS domain S-box-containing protein